MVKQRSWKEFTYQQKIDMTSQIKKFTDRLFSDTSPAKGILKRRSERTRKLHQLYPHQPLAARSLVSRSSGTKWAERKASMLAIHDVGTGKTITAILAAAAALAMPVTDKTGPRGTEKIMIVCPKSVLQVWYETLLEWTQLTDGGRILLVAEQAKVDAYQVRDAKIVLTTPDVLVAAWKTFMYMRDGPEFRNVPKNKRWAHGVDPKDAKRVAEFGGLKPQPHALFRPLADTPVNEPVFLLTVVDEVHLIGDSTTQKGHVVSMFTKHSVYKLGLTGTPVQARPDDLASLAQALDAQPKELQNKAFYTPKDDKDGSLNKPNIDQFHKQLVDRVDLSVLDLPERKIVTLVYDPWVGWNRHTAAGLPVDAAAAERHDALIKEERKVAIEGHNALLENACRTAKSMQVGEQEAQALDEAKWGEGQRKIFEATIRMGQYEFSSILGANGGAKGFELTPSLFEQAAAAPSQAMLLIERVILDRQKACHPRIAIFCEHVTELRIMKRYLELRRSDVGDLFFFESKLSPSARKRMIDTFLSCNKGVFFFSGAGSVGITLCPGCEVLLSVGPLPWNPTTIDQAFGRVYRIGQQKPVEIVQFVARRSVTSAKLRLHEDKRNRLGRAATDLDYRDFEVANESKWRFTERILKECKPLNEFGNYRMSPECDTQAKQARAKLLSWGEEMIRWNEAKEQAHANGVAPPPKPLKPTTPAWLLAEYAPLPLPDKMPLPPPFPC